MPMPREQDEINVRAKLIELRTRRNVTQAEIADAAGVHVSTVARIEQGRHRPSLSTLRRLAFVLECSIDDLA